MDDVFQNVNLLLVLIHIIFTLTPVYAESKIGSSSTRCSTFGTDIGGFVLTVSSRNSVIGGKSFITITFVRFTWCIRWYTLRSMQTDEIVSGADFDFMLTFHSKKSLGANTMLIYFVMFFSVFYKIRSKILNE